MNPPGGKPSIVGFLFVQIFGVSVTCETVVGGKVGKGVAMGVAVGIGVTAGVGAGGAVGTGVGEAGAVSFEDEGWLGSFKSR
jgi:hypothetical protein